MSEQFVYFDDHKDEGANGNTGEEKDEILTTAWYIPVLPPIFFIQIALIWQRFDLFSEEISFLARLFFIRKPEVLL